MAVNAEKVGNGYVRELMNAYQRAGYAVVIGVQNFLTSDFEPDVLHVQWPEAIYQWELHMPTNADSCSLIERRLSFYKRRRIPVVLTMHNIQPHGLKSDFNIAMYKLFIKYADIVVHHGRKSIAQCSEVFSELVDKINIIGPHGPYPVEEINKEDARLKLGLPLDALVVMNFGRVRQYKGPDFVKTVFGNLKLNNVIFYVTGYRKSGRLYKRVVFSILKRLRQVFRFGHIRYSYSEKVYTDLEVGELMSACDILFLGHSSGLSSGLVSLAASYRKPVVYPDLGNFSEQLNGWHWQKSYVAGDVLSARKSITEMIELIGKDSGQLNYDNLEWIKHNSWNIHIERVMDAVFEFRGVRA